MFLQVGGTAIVQLLNFAIFFALLNAVFLRPVGKAIRERRDYINGLTHDYDRYQAEAASLRVQADSVRAQARREAEQLLAKERAGASDAAAALASQAARRAAETVEEAHRQVAIEMESARRGQPKTVAELAELMLARTVPGMKS